MPDISMCNGGNCQKKETCYRYTATPDKYWQSYTFLADHLTPDGNCYEYIEDWRKVKEAGQ